MPGDDDVSVDDGTDGQSYETDDPRSRWKGLSTIVGIPIALHFPALVIVGAMGMVDLGAVPQGFFIADTLGWLGVLTYIYGQDTILTAKEVLDL